MATIGDVAKAAGVSRSTVSYALSGNRPISRDTRERIDAAIAALGFTVNAGARALATSRTRVLGLILRFQEDEFAPAMLPYIMAISRAARESGFDVLMVTDEDGVGAVERVTSSNMVDGVILLDVEEDDSRLPVLREARQPGVLVGLPRDTDGVDAVDLDFAEAARVIVTHLHGRQHREVALILPPRHVFDRGASYARLFRDAALRHAEELGMLVRASHGDVQDTAVDRSLHDALDAYPRASALVVHNDASIAALPDVLRVRALAVPRDLSVIGLYARGFGRAFRLPYTAVETAPDDIGRAAVQQLLRRIVESDGVPHDVRLITPRVVDRGSTSDAP